MNKTALLVLAAGFEETEAVVPADFLRRCEVDVTVAGLGDREVRSAHGITIKADTVFDENIELPDAVILPGGSPGAENLAADIGLKGFLLNMSSEDKVIAAICASPALVLNPAGLLKGKKATCYPGLEKNFSSDMEFLDQDVVTDGQLITSRGPGTVFAFSKAVASLLCGKSKADAVSEMMLAG